MPATSKPKRYNPRHPERGLLYQTVAAHYETWPEIKPPRITRHAGYRCGMTVMRKTAKPLSQPQTGMNRPKRRRTLRSTSASVGKLGW
jgi:hypothetical protein